MTSVTIDEYAHLPAGLAYWKYGEFSIYNLSPPTARMLTVWPALWTHPEIPRANKFRKYEPRSRHAFYGAAFQSANDTIPGQYHSIFAIARLGMLPLCWSGLILVFSWARKLFGPAAGIAAAVMWTFNPDIIAHASITGTDLGFTVFTLLTLWLWMRFCARPTNSGAVLTGVALALANLAKFTGVLLLPILIVTGLIAVARQKALRRSLLAGFIVVVIVSYVLVNLGYNYDRTFDPLSKYDFSSRTLSTLAARLPSWLPVPLPRQYVIGFDAQKFEAEGQYFGYLRDQTYRGGRWSYYPIALAAKFPLSFLILIAIACASRFALPHLSQESRRDGFYVLIGIGSLAVGFMLSTEMNIGVRYLLPIYPLAFIAIASLLAPQVRMSIRTIATVLLLTMTVESFAAFPRYFTFFNLLAGGPGNGYHVISDSAFDWGQSLIDLKSWMIEHDVDRVRLAYHGRVMPRAYAIQSTPFVEGFTLNASPDAHGSDEAYVAVSHYFLTGIPIRTAVATGASDFVVIESYRELRQKTPVAIVGSIFVYRQQDVAAAEAEYRASGAGLPEHLPPFGYILAH